MTRKGGWPKFFPREKDPPPIPCHLCGARLTSVRARKAIMGHLWSVHHIINVRERSEMADLAMLVWRSKE